MCGWDFCEARSEKMATIKNYCSYQPVHENMYTCLHPLSVAVIWAHAFIMEGHFHRKVF